MGPDFIVLAQIGATLLLICWVASFTADLKPIGALQRSVAVALGIGLLLIGIAFIWGMPWARGFPS